MFLGRSMFCLYSASVREGSAWLLVIEGRRDVGSVLTCSCSSSVIVEPVVVVFLLLERGFKELSGSFVSGGKGASGMEDNPLDRFSLLGIVWISVDDDLMCLVEVIFAGNYRNRLSHIQVWI